MSVFQRTAVLLACACVLLFAADVRAASIAVNFGADEPNGARSDVTGPAGVLGTAIWNNVDGPAGTAMNLDGVDSGGTATTTSAGVTWSTTNTWSSQGRGEENNTAPDGNDRNLMTGYLDQDAAGVTTTVELTGLDSFFTTPVDVYVYIQGGVNGRGGDYTIGAETQTHTVTAAFDGTYLLNDGTNPMGSNYLIFENVSGGSFMLTAMNNIGGTPRAGINAVEIVGESEDILEGDVNLDNAVDNLDFEIIRDNMKTGTTRAQGDLDFSGLTALPDFRIWKNAFEMGGAPAAVPEPTTLALWLIGAAIIAFRRAARRICV
jgi:hypothetical protein